MKSKNNPGDIAFEVEWCPVLPLFEDGSADIDHAQYKREYSKTESGAEVIARRVYPLDKFGAVRITKVEWRDQHEGTKYAGLQFRWEVISDTKEYTGD